MVIDKKIAYVKKKELFEPLIPTIPTGLNPIVFIEDTREMWTCGTYFSIGYPSIEVSEESGSIKVTIGNSFFMMSTTGESISVRKGDGNRIILSSNALNRVDTDVPLEWVTADRKLIHKKSGTNAGTFGQSTNVNNASIFSIPNVTVDEWGHVTDIANRNVSIRDYVEQLTPSTSIGERNVLLAYSDMDVSESAQVRKANGMSYNDATKKLILTGGLNSTGAVNVVGSDLTVIDGYIIGKLKGDVEGSATPKIHLSLKPEYGGSSLELYGHVKLQDTLNSKPNPSTSNTNINNTEITAIAASPLMVWNAIETAKAYADSILGANNAMLYKGALEAGLSAPGTYTPAADIGNTYVVTFGSGNYIDNVGYINGEPVEIGDLLICKESAQASNSSNWQDVKKKWTYVQTNTTGVVSGPSASIVGQLAIFNSTTGKLIKGLANGSIGQMMVIGSAGIPKWEDKPDRLNHKLKFRYNLVDFLEFDGHEEKIINFIAGDNMFITVDAQGNITLAADPGSDTVNTAGATNLINRKLFLIGAESQTTSPQTYSNQYVYVGTDNCLYSNGIKVSTEGHTHLYAGSLTAGGAALRIDLNPVGLLGASYGTYAGVLQDSTNGPIEGSWSNRLKILHNNESGYYTELAQAITGVEGLWHRRNTAGSITGWTPVIDKSNFHTYLDDTYIQKQTDPNQLKNFVRYSLEGGLTMNWTIGNATPTHVWGTKDGESGQAYIFSGDNIRAFANAVNRAGDTMTGALKVTEIQSTGGNGLVMYSGTTYTYLGMQAGTTYIRSGATDLQHRYNGTDYNIWDARNLVGLRTEHSHNTINHIDNRETASTPQEHSAGVWLDFKSNAKANLTDGGSYTGLLTVRKYGSTSDWSGGKAAQLGFTDNSNVWVRFGTGTAWEAWKQLATTGWADGKFLPLAGGTMTGSITISTDSVVQWSRNTDYAKIHFKNTGDSDADSYLGFETGDNGNEYFKFSGKSGSTLTQWMSIKSNGVTAPAFIKSGSSAAYVLLGDGGHKALNQFIYSTYGSCGVNERTGNSDDLGRAGFWRDNNLGAYGVTLMHSDSANYQCKIYHDYGTGGNLYMKSRANGTWGSVYTIWNSANFDPNTKVNKAGDTMTGRLTIQSAGLNGTYSGLLVGDDCYIGDCNMVNTIGIMGTTNNSAGMIKLGKSGYQFGYNGSNHFVSGSGLWTNLNADLLDGVHNGNVTANYVNANSQQTLSLTHLDSNTWYPCVMYAGPGNSTPVRVTFCNALSSNVPSWSTHGGGFSFQFDFDWIGGGWGTISWYLRIYRHSYSFANDDPCYGLEQRNNRSALVLYMRGGANYQYRTTDGRSFSVYSSNTNIGDSTYPDYVAPRTSRLNNEWEQEASSRVGTCAIASKADRATVADSTERANMLSGHSASPDGSHPGYGAKVFYSWNIGQANNSSAGYSNGITIGSNPGDQAYGFQIVQNMWDDRTYTRRYNSGWQSWKALATTEDVANAIPSGTIIMWLGDNIPSGWEDITSLFDGRFPMGAGTARHPGWGTSVKNTYSAGVNTIGGDDYVTVDGDYLPNHYHRFVNGTNNYWGGTYTESSSDGEFKKISSLNGNHNRGHDSGESTHQGIFRTGSKCNSTGYNYNSSTYAYFTLIPKYRAVRFLRKL